MGRAEQREERELLDYIFPDEIHDVSETEFRITITLDILQPHEEDDGDAPVIVLNIKYPPAYPNEAPLLDITQPPNAQRRLHFSVQNDKATLLKALEPTIEQNMGVAMVDALVSALKESAEQLVAERQLAVQAEKDAESAKAEEEENRKFEGEKVTRESFLKWRESFRQQVEEHRAKKIAEVEAEDKKKRGGKLEEKKLTGKQLWEQGLAGKVLEEDEDEEMVVLAVKDLKVGD